MKKPKFFNLSNLVQGCCQLFQPGKFLMILFHDKCKDICSKNISEKVNNNTSLYYRNLTKT